MKKKGIPMLQPCGHPMSLLVKSVESDHQFCELCEARRERNDALQMEVSYKQRLAITEEALRVIGIALKEPAGGEYHSARKFLDDRDIFNGDLEGTRVLFQVTQVALKDRL